MLWLGPMMPRYGWDTGGWRLSVGGWDCGGVGGSARSGWPPPEPKFGKESWELGRGTVTWRQMETHKNGIKIQRREGGYGRRGFYYEEENVQFAFELPVALQNWPTECCYSNYSVHAAAPAPNTYLNADSSPVEPGGDIMSLEAHPKNPPKIQAQHKQPLGAHLQQVCVYELRAPHA